MRTMNQIGLCAPELGAHTDEVLSESGFSEIEIGELRAGKSIGDRRSELLGALYLDSC